MSASGFTRTRQGGWKTEFGLACRVICATAAVPVAAIVVPSTYRLKHSQAAFRYE